MANEKNKSVLRRIETISETVTSGFEIHLDGEAESYTCWAKTPTDLEKVKELAEKFKTKKGGEKHGL